MVIAVEYKNLRFVFWYSICLIVCCQRHLRNKKRGIPRHLRTSTSACNKWISAPSSCAVRVPCSQRMYMYIFTRVLTFFEDTVTKTSNHHFSLSLSHNDSHTRFSFLLRLQFAHDFDTVYVQGKYCPATNKTSLLKKCLSIMYIRRILISPTKSTNSL